MRARVCVGLCAALVATAVACRGPATTPELQSLLALAKSPLPDISGGAWADTTAFYTDRQQSFAWVDRDEPSDITAAAPDVLQSASAHGLSAEDYSVAALRELRGTFGDNNKDDSGSAERLARLDVGLTSALLQLGRDVATGRLNADVIDARWNARRNPPDYVAALAQARTQGVQTFLEAVQPHHPEYAALQRALASLANSTDAASVDARRRVALNLERWRWLPDDLGRRHFIVNVPSFQLIAREANAPVMDIRVVVGKQGDETPLFSDDMEQVVFSPYWNVPDTIAANETVPALARDPDFLERNNMEVVDRRGRVVDAASIPWGDEEAMRAVRFRQRPGARNALGLVKFLFPNEYAVYLHDTPADALFARTGRAFSHGCIRVEQPEALAQYVLRDQPEWTAEAIRAAMHAGDERHVKLKESIPVYIVYLTAWVDNQEALRLEKDVYGYDARQARHQ